MTEEEKYLVIDELIKHSISITQLNEHIEHSIETIFDITDPYCYYDNKLYKNRYNLILELLQTYNFIKEGNNGFRYMFTDKWEELRKIGSLEQYLLNLKEKEDYELSLKERSKEIAEESLQLSKDANKISEDANGISKKAKNISFGSFIVAILSTFIAAGALVYSIINSDSKEIKELSKKIESIEKENTLTKETLQEYIKYIDSLNIDIKKLKDTNER